MALGRNKRTEDHIRIPLSCLAEFVTSKARSPESLLRAYKYNKRGEGFARSSYYQYAITAIRNYHSNDNDPEAFKFAPVELAKRADATGKSWERSKLRLTPRPTL